MKKIILLFIIFIFSHSMISAQWTLVGPLGGFVNCFKASGSNIFAGTNNGIFLSTNNGMSWVRSMSTEPIQTIEINGSSIIAGTDDGIWLSSNFGQSWSHTIHNINVVGLVVDPSPG